MEIIDVDYTEVPDEPITETWYTCPSCGCITPTGKICSCGYHPQSDAPTQPQAPAKKQRVSVAAIVLVVALVLSLFYNFLQASEKADLSGSLSQANAEIASYQQEIDGYKDAISTAREHNRYLKEDLTNLCPGLPINSSDTEFRHNVRNCGNPFIYSVNQKESVDYWWHVELNYGDFFQ